MLTTRSGEAICSFIRSTRSTPPAFSDVPFSPTSASACSTLAALAHWNGFIVLMLIGSHSFDALTPLPVLGERRGEGSFVFRRRREYARTPLPNPLPEYG